MLKREFDYFIANQTELVNKYLNKFIVIKNEKVVGVYDSHIQAYNESIKTMNLGTFLIQHCLPGNEAYSQTFQSRVIINSLLAH